MTISVSFNPTTLSDDERQALLNMLAVAGVPAVRVFEGTAAGFSAQSAAPVVADVPTAERLAAEDVPSAGATSPIEAFGMSAPVVETSAAVAFTAPAVEQAPVAVAPPANVVGVETDTQGQPYDARIHSSSREKIKDGTWKVKRGIDPALVESVRAEYRKVMAIPSPAKTPDANWPFPLPSSLPKPPPPAVTVSEPVGEWTANGAWPLKVQPAEMPQVVNVAPPTLTASPNASPATAVFQPAPALTFPLLMQQVGAAITSGRMAESDVHAICSRHGVPIHTLGSRPDLLPIIGAEILAKANG